MINLLPKFKVFFLFFWVVTSSLFSMTRSSREWAQEVGSFCFSPVFFEIKLGYFFFSDPKMNRIYNRGGVDIQLCGSYPLYKVTNKWNLSAYGALEYFCRSGKSSHGHQKTSVWSVPVNIGLKVAYEMDANKQYYFVIGPRCFYIHQRSHSPYIYKSNSRRGVGLFMDIGLNYSLCDHCMIAIFGEYSCAKIHFRSSKSYIYTRNIPVGGCTFGGGFRYQF